MSRAPLALIVLALASCDRPPSKVVWPATTNAAPGDPSPARAEPALSPACGKAPAPDGVHRRDVAVFGAKRTYTLVVPPGLAAGTSTPLVFVLHGHGGTGAQARSAFDLEAAADHKALFVYPDASHGGWDLDAPTGKNRDVALFDAILAVTQSSYCVDLRRVFVTGFSNGAYMANQLGCRRGDRVRAVASHAGGGPYETEGTYDATGHLVCPGKAVASLVVHGSADGTVAPSEGQKSIDHWTFANRCGGSAPSSPAGCVTYRSCASPVVACSIKGLGHALAPGAARLTWSFFDAQR